MNSIRQHIYSPVMEAKYILCFALESSRSQDKKQYNVRAFIYMHCCFLIEDLKCVLNLQVPLNFFGGKPKRCEALLSTFLFFCYKFYRFINCHEQECHILFIIWHQYRICFRLVRAFIYVHCCFLIEDLKCVLNLQVPLNFFGGRSKRC